MTFESVIKAIEFAIDATGQSDAYTTGMCNGLLYAKSLMDGKNPEYFNVDGGGDSND